MNIKTFQGGYDKNFSYLIWCEKTRHAAIVDAATEFNPIKEYIETSNLILTKILITHTHSDHIIYLNDFLNFYPNITVCCYTDPINMKVDYKGVIDNEIIVLGNEILTAIYTPGHFKDSVCFWDKKNSTLFTGDTMFVGRTGRTVSITSNINDLYNSIYNKLFKLPKQTIIYPGHNYGYTPSISIKESIDLFDFFSCKSLADFCVVMQNFEKNIK